MGSPAPRLLLIKAQDDKPHQLMDQLVLVAGHVRDGHQVAPHTAKRKKAIVVETPKMYSRGGMEVKPLSYNHKTKTGRYMGVHTCHRCGGAGRSDAWARTGYTCYECGGRGKWPEEHKCYTKEKLDKLNAAAKAKRDKAEAERQAKYEARQAEHRAALEAYREENKVLLARAEPYRERSDMIRDLLEKGEQYASLSDKQKAFLVSLISKIEADAGSEYLGEIGERVRFRGTIEKVLSGESNSRWSAYWYITMIRTEAGHVIKYFNTIGEEGETLQFSGTVKAHEEYNGVKQTILQRMKVIG